MLIKYKVYLFYLKKTNELYAFTINEDYKNKFLEQRNKKCFIVKKKKMDEIEYSAFSAKYNTLMLAEFPLSTSIKEYCFIIATYKEDENLIERSNEIDSDMNYAKMVLITQGNLKDKFVESVEYMTDIVYYTYDNGYKEPISKIDLFKLFIDTYYDTFVCTESEEYDDI